MRVAAMYAPVIFHGVEQSGLIVGLGAVMADIAQIGQRAPGAQAARDLVVDRPRGRAARLRIQRQHNQAPDAGRTQHLEHLPDIGRGIQKCLLDLNAAPRGVELTLDRRAQLRAVEQQR